MAKLTKKKPTSDQVSCVDIGPHEDALYAAVNKAAGAIERIERFAAIADDPVKAAAFAKKNGKDIRTAMHASISLVSLLASIFSGEVAA